MGNFEGIKGVIQMTVVVDYGELLKDENIKGVQAFTGKKAPQDVMNVHLKQVLNSISDPLRDNPFIKFNAEGKVIDEKDIQQKQEQPQPKKNSSAPIENQNGNSGEKVEEEIVESPTEPPISDGEFKEDVDAEEGIESLDSVLASALVKVASSLGIPNAIKMPLSTIRTLTAELDGGAGSTTLEKYKGIDVIQEGMAEKFTISYVSYEDQKTIKEYTPSEG
jgi:hypothetical protein